MVCRLEVALYPFRRRSGLRISARRAGAAAPAPPGYARVAHHPRDPLTADRHARVGQLGVNSRRTVCSPAASVNLLNADCQGGIGLGTVSRCTDDVACPGKDDEPPGPLTARLPYAAAPR